MTLREGLVQAAKHVEGGWCQGEMEHKGSFCMVGALRQTFCNGGIWGDETPQYDRALRRISKLVKTRWITDWNDSPKRKQSDVARVLRQAARI